MEDFSLYEKLIESYNWEYNRSGIQGDRLAARLNELSKIGATQENGVTRTGYSKEEKLAKDLLIKWMKKIGMEVRIDGAGNVFAQIKGKYDKPAIAAGSHLDSVPNGGHFDGPLGVLAALEVAEAWKSTGYVPEKPYIVTIFSDEEGARFKSGLTGSRAFMGQISEEELNRLKDEKNNSFEEVMKEYGSTTNLYLAAKKHFEKIESFVEVHIEQGTVLESVDQAVGIVSGIAGPAWLEVIFKGEAGHAGNTPMAKRKDPLVSASLLIAEIEKLPSKVSDSAVATVGKLDVLPNGSNVIPGEVSMIIDARDIFEETRDELLELIIAKAEEIAEARETSVDINYNTKITPLPIENELKNKLAESLVKFNVEPHYIPSGAGHDAMILGREIPSAMIFVKSKGGISHNPKEWTSLNDCVLSVHILKDYVEGLMEEE